MSDISFTLSMVGSSPLDDKMQKLLKLNQEYVGLGIYKSFGVEIKLEDGVQIKTPQYYFLMDGEKVGYTANQVQEVLGLQ